MAVMYGKNYVSFYIDAGVVMGSVYNNLVNMPDNTESVSLGGSSLKQYIKIIV